MEASTASGLQNVPQAGGGVLPDWASQAVFGAAAVLSGLILLVTGKFTIALFVILGIVFSLPAIYIWSRSAEGARRAKDRLMTMSIFSAFLIAVAPLFSLLYEVVSRGSARFDGDFCGESARNVVGAGGGAEHAIIGTLVITGVATLISVPIGILAAIYLTEY